MKKKVLCTALAVTMLLTTTASATAKPWWLSKYRVIFDNELGMVGDGEIAVVIVINGPFNEYGEVFAENGDVKLAHNGDYKPIAV